MEFKLRPWETNDVENLVKYASNPRIFQFMSDGFPNPFTVEKAKTFIEFANSGTNKLYRAIVVEGQAVGGIGISQQSDIKRKNAELGYWLGESFWGNGIISRAIPQIVEMAFANFDITRIFATPFATNIASHRVLEKSGFKLEARFEKSVYKNGEFLDELIYAINKNSTNDTQLSHETAIQKINRELFEKQQFLDSILTNAPLIIWSIDLEGIFTYSQYAGDLSLPDNERIGKSAFEIYKGTEVENFLRKVLRDEIRNELLQVGNIHYDTRVSPIFNSKGEKTGYMGVSIDISERVHSEENLKKLRLALDQAPVSVFIMDSNWNFEYINPEFVKISGYSSEELLHKNIMDTLYEKIAGVPESRQKIVSSLMEGQSWKGELLTINKDGSNYWAETIAAPYKNENGEVDGYIVIQQDVTEKRATEKALLESEFKYKTLVENSLDGIIIVRNNKTLFVNDTFCNMLGYGCEPLFNFPATHFIHPDDRPKALKTAGERKSGNNSTTHNFYRLVKSDGGIIDCESYSSVIDYKGEPASFITIHDVTERKKMEIALLESEEKYRTLVENSQDGIGIVQDGYFRFVNSAMSRMLGYSAEEFYAMDGKDILPLSIRDEIMKIHYDRMEGKLANANYPMQLIAKDGRIIDVETFSSTFSYEGRPAGYLTLHDITERKRMLEALERNEQKYRQLTEMLPQTVYELDTKGNITYMNQTGLEKFGITTSDFGVSAFSLIAHEEHEKMRLNMKKSLEEGYYTPGNNYTAIHKNGEKFPVMIFASPMKTDGVVTGTRGIILDMTEHEAMESALRDSEEKYRLLFEAESDAIFMIDVETGQILDVNPAATAIYGYSREELLQMKNTDISAEPDETAEATKRNDKFVLLRYHRKKDNSIIPVELSAGFTDYKGVKIQIVTSRDITHNKQMQDAMRESEEKYRHLVELTNSIILKWDRNANVQFMNEYGLSFFGYEKDEIFNKSVIGTIVPKIEDDSERNLELLMIDIFKNPEAFERNINENMRKNGERVWILWNNKAIRDETGEVTTIYSIGNDITERKKNEEELRITKEKLQALNENLEKKVNETVNKLADANTLLIRLQKENLQSQFEVLRQQVNPHFLFNSLNVLTSLIKLEPDLAEKFTEHLSKVYRYVLENKDNDLVDLKTELDFIDAYLFLLNIRFMDKIVVNINIEDEKTDLLVLPLALQLLIENAIKHNSMSKKAPLRIDLFIDGNNFLNVVNNLQERESYIASTGVGLKNIEHRYELLEMPAPQFIKTEKSFIAQIPLKENCKQH